MSRKFKIGGSSKSLRELWAEKTVAAATPNSAAIYNSWSNVNNLASASADDYKNFRFKINKKGEMEPVLNEETDIGVDDIVFSASKSNLRRIADIERNVSILANRIATIDAKADIVSGSEDDFDNWITETTAFTADVTLGRSGSTTWWGGATTSRVDVDGHLYVNNGITLGSTAQEVVRDLVGDMVSGTETGITVTHDDAGNTLSFTVTSAPKWATARTITLGGDASGSVSIDGSANATLTVTVADDSHNHVISNVDGLQTALDGKLGSSANAVSASKLATARTIALGGDVSGSVSFDGSANVTITAVVADDSHNHVISNIDGLQTALDAKATPADITAAINSLVDGAPAALDTLNELAAAIGDNANYAASITTALAGKLGSSANAVSASKWATARTITLGGDLTGNVSIDGSANVTLTASVAANSVALGTDTTGNYVAAGAVSGNGLTGSASAEGATFTVTSNATSANTADTIVFRDASGNFSANVITATATQARYADLAERYAADAHYEEGTVVVFGGEAEVTASTSFAQRSVAGVVSTNPALMMNSEAGNSETHPYIALQGRVPVKVTGDVKKGDILVASDVSGTATAWNNDDSDPRMTAYVGIAIADAVDGVVEAKVGK